MPDSYIEEQRKKNASATLSTILGLWIQETISNVVPALPQVCIVNAPLGYYLGGIPKENKDTGAILPNNGFNVFFFFPDGEKQDKSEFIELQTPREGSICYSSLYTSRTYDIADLYGPTRPLVPEGEALFVSKMVPFCLLDGAKKTNW